MAAIQTIRKTVDVFDQLSELIANPPSDRPIAAAVGNGGRTLCDAYGNLQLSQQLLSGQFRPILNLLCKPYFDGAGFDSPQAVTPFTGGQCAGSRYTLTGTYTVACGFAEGQSRNWQSGGGLAIGPITGIVPTDTGWAVAHAGQNIVEVISSANFQGIGRVPRPGVACSQVQNQELTANTPPTIGAVLPFGGDPDNCGDPDPTLVPGANPPPPAAPFPTGQQPGVDPDGQPFFFIPDIEVPDQQPLPLDDEPLGGGPAPVASPAGGDGLPGDPEAIAPEAGEVTGGEDGEDIDFGEPPEGRVWIGCIIETSSVGALGNIAGTGPESTVWPTVRANAALNYGSRKGTSNRINSKFHDLIRPATSLIVTGVFLQVQPGSTSKVFPLSALTCPENPCED